MKYKDAIFYLQMAIEYPKGKYGDSRLIDLCFDKLQELEEKTTPKKVICCKNDESVPHDSCPECGAFVDAEYRHGYCSYCGQKLDWNI